MIVQRLRRARLVAFCPVVLAIAFGGSLFADSAAGDTVCPELWRDGGVGPWDFTDSGRDLAVVERRHFTRDVEMLIRGESASVGADLNYTLNVIPNHPRALDAVSRLALREGRAQPRGLRLSVECWFRRAFDYRPEDINVHVVYAVHQNRHGRRDSAIETLQKAADIAPASAQVHYNLGLLLLERGDFELARAHAERAYLFGATPDGLRQRLARAGHPVQSRRSQSVEEHLDAFSLAFERGDYDAAREALEQALAQSPRDPEIHYNLGIVLVRQDLHEEALSHAEQAYALGFPHPGLRNALQRAGYELSED